MTALTATSQACTNIALIKYWGNINNELRLPANGSISMNLRDLYTKTSVTFDERLDADLLQINGSQVTGYPFDRVSHFLDIVRQMAATRLFARIESVVNFPMGAGLASSASAFAALALAASTALGLNLNEKALSALARRGSGSAARSIPGGFVEWYAAEQDQESYAVSISPQDHWNLRDLITVIDTAHKSVGSTQGHARAATSPIQSVRIQTAADRLTRCRQAVLERDFNRLAEVVEMDCNLMHATMITSSPQLFYWEPATVEVIKAVQSWRAQGLEVCYTIDAGANVHVICTESAVEDAENLLCDLLGVKDLLGSPPGGPTVVLTNE